MSAIRQYSVAVLCAVLLGCGVPRGEPLPASVPLAPKEVMDFELLYAANCAGCHGAQGKGGAAIALADPAYLALADESALRKAIADGVPGTAMPPFAEKAGGLLTATQIDTITAGLRSRWSRPGVLEGMHPPTYAAQSLGDVQSGAAAYKTHCESCHGAGGCGGPKGSAITNDSFLALISDQGLRTIVIAGRPELGMPDWRGGARGIPLSDREVTDLVAWLVSQRAPVPGQPYPSLRSSHHEEPSRNVN